MPKSIHVLLTLAVAAGIGAGAAAAEDGASDVKQLVGSASFVARTKVTHVTYQMSAAGPNGEAPVPYTLVDYDVAQTLVGASAGSTISLRYIGGPDGRGHFLSASNVPVFQAGDQDILFVRGNGADGCALVSCDGGRFRILDGGVYAGDGTPVRGVNGTKVVASGAAPAALTTVSYPAPSFDELIKDPEAQATLRRLGLSVDAARKRYAAEAPRTIVMSTQSNAPASADVAVRGERASAAAAAAEVVPMAVDKFVAMVQHIETPASRRSASFQSAAAGSTLKAPSAIAMPPASPAAAAGLRGDGATKSASDIAEERRMPKEDLSAFRNKAP